MKMIDNALKIIFFFITKLLVSTMRAVSKTAYKQGLVSVKFLVFYFSSPIVCQDEVY